MKFSTPKITFTAVALGATLIGVAGAQNAPRLILNGQPLSTQVAPVIQNGRALVPLRDIFEALGARVRYNANNRTIAARRQGTVVRMELGRRRTEVDGERVRLDVPATVVDGSTMVPLRFVSEALGATVRFNANRGVIRINDRAGVPNNLPRNQGSQDTYPEDEDNFGEQ